MMPTRSEGPVAVSGKPSKTVELLRKKFRQLLRVIVVLTVCVAIAASAFAIWWLNSLNGLPDIGDPFDVAAFRAFRIPGDQNAFAFLRRAHEKHARFRGRDGKGPYPDDPKFSWSIANPKLREWAGENREALELFLQGANQPDAAHAAGEPTTRMDLSDLDYVVFLEGSRRQENGDTAGAWDCYRALLRMITHIRRRGSAHQRYSAGRASVGLQRRLTDWSTDSQTTTAQVHTALDEVLRNEPNPDWDIFAIKYGYLELIRELERPKPLSVSEEIEEQWRFGRADMALSPTMIEYLEAARRFLLREPERSRRVLRLLCAQYLARAETRGLQPPKPAVWAKFTYLTSTNPMTKGTIHWPLYPVSREASAGARALSPQELAGWWVASLDARLPSWSFDEWPWPPDRVADRRAVADRKAYRELIIMLATEIYRRERGTLPSSDEDLVGTYLESLPDDSSPDVDDGTAPTVEERILPDWKKVQGTKRLRGRRALK
jgi:hypothetical protein